jgi:gliding motility-associated-like protein
VPSAQPRFTAHIYDVTDNRYVDCPAFDFVAASDLPGFKISNPGLMIYYKDWSSATINLSNYAGKTIRLEFTTNDCAGGIHFGYAYLDLRENTSSSPITGNSYCTGQKSVSLLAPPGFATYTWYNADFSTQLRQGQRLTIFPPPPDMTKYALKVTPYPGYGCVDTFYTVVNKINAGFNFNVKDTVLACPGTKFDLTAPYVTTGSTAGLLFDYFRDSLATAYLYNANAIDTTGTYYIRAMNTEGCTNILPVRVVFAPPSVKFIQPPAVVFPTTIDLSKAIVMQSGFTYSYYRDATATIPLFNYTAINKSGTYFVKVINNTGCANIVPINITVLPPPPYAITAPNTFTPNNDGINDHFNLTTTGVITFGSLKIFNRYGQQVFNAKSFGEYWDGNYNGKNLPSGTYYWIFDGEDDYNNVKINKAGSITLLR